VTINDSPVFGFKLDVRREGHPPLEMTVRQQVPRMFVGAVLPGSTVMVRQDPAGPGLELPVAADREDPEHLVAIAWDEV
jgi:hypothetical protein